MGKGLGGDTKSGTSTFKVSRGLKFMKKVRDKTSGGPYINYGQECT